MIYYIKLDMIKYNIFVDGRRQESSRSFERASPDGSPGPRLHICRTHSSQKVPEQWIFWFYQYRRFHSTIPYYPRYVDLNIFDFLTTGTTKILARVRQWIAKNIPKKNHHCHIFFSLFSDTTVWIAGYTLNWVRIVQHTSDFIPLSGRRLESWIHCCSMERIGWKR